MPEQRFDQSQSLLQQQTIAPQMQQSLQLLQTPTLELRQLIQQELVQNPTLEEESTDISLEEAGTGDEEDFDREFAELSQLDEECANTWPSRGFPPRNATMPTRSTSS